VHATVAVLSVALGRDLFPWFNAHGIEADPGKLLIGLEQVNGKAWFDDVTVAVAKPPVRREARAVVGQPFAGHDRPRLRGAMISPDIDAAGLRVLGREWDSSYHAFREWSGWSVEHGSDRSNTKPSAEPTNRQRQPRLGGAPGEPGPRQGMHPGATGLGVGPGPGR